ncbi:MAG: hypothetical protein R2853_11065 [Thermomicrobiales bacterium]
MAEAFAAFDALHFTGDVLELSAGHWHLDGAAAAHSRYADRHRYRAGDGRPERGEGGQGAGALPAGRSLRLAARPAVRRRYFCFWISHVPEERLDGFLRKVAAALKPGGKLFYIDSHPRIKPAQPSAIQLPPEPGSQVLTRKLNDGRAYRIVKNFLEPRALEARCAAAGLNVQVHETPHAFIYGTGVRAGR